jgi:hypothetical protein
MEVNPVQLENARHSILITPSGIITEVKCEQPKNAKECINLTLSGITNTPVIDVGTEINTTFASLSYCTPFLSFQRLSHPSNAQIPMEVTLSGIMIEDKLEQPKNAKLPMNVTLLGILIEVKLEQFMNAPYPIDSMPSGIFTDFKLE